MPHRSGPPKNAPPCFAASPRAASCSPPLVLPQPFDPKWLALIALGMLAAYGLRRYKCTKWQAYVLLAGPCTWVGLLYANLHPALALVFVVPFMPLEIENDITWLFGGDPDAHHSPLHDFEHDLKNFVDFVVLFAFGAVNAGISLNGAGGLTGVVLLALVLGKTLGVVAFATAAEAAGYPLPAGMTVRDVWFVGLIASIGCVCVCVWCV